MKATHANNSIWGFRAVQSVISRSQNMVEYNIFPQFPNINTKVFRKWRYIIEDLEML